MLELASLPVGAKVIVGVSGMGDVMSPPLMTGTTVVVPSIAVVTLTIDGGLVTAPGMRKLLEFVAVGRGPELMPVPTAMDEELVPVPSVMEDELTPVPSVTEDEPRPVPDGIELELAVVPLTERDPEAVLAELEVVKPVPSADEVLTAMEELL